MASYAAEQDEAIEKMKQHDATSDSGAVLASSVSSGGAHDKHVQTLEALLQSRSEEMRLLEEKVCFF